MVGRVGAVVGRAGAGASQAGAVAGWVGAGAGRVGAGARWVAVVGRAGAAWGWVAVAGRAGAGAMGDRRGVAGMASGVAGAMPPWRSAAQLGAWGAGQTWGGGRGWSLAAARGCPAVLVQLLAGPGAAAPLLLTHCSNRPR